MRRDILIRQVILRTPRVGMHVGHIVGKVIIAGVGVPRSGDVGVDKPSLSQVRRQRLGPVRRGWRN